MHVSDRCNRYAVVPTESKLTFEASTSLHPVRGAASDLHGYVEAAWNPDGMLVLDPPPAIRLELQVERLRSGNAMQDREMWRLIDSRRFPLVVAELRSLQAAGASGRYRATGDVTLAGRVRRYDGELTATEEGDRISIEGALVVDVRDFGMKPPRFLMLKVEPRVSVNLQLIAVRAAEG